MKDHNEIKANIIVIKTPTGYYITEDGNNGYQPYVASRLEGYLFDGKSPAKTWSRDWLMIGQPPTTIVYPHTIPSKVAYYKLIDPSLESNKIPLELTADVCHDDPDTGLPVWNEKMYHLSSLYEPVETPPEKVEEPVEFTFTVVCEVGTPLVAGVSAFSSVSVWKVKHRLIDEIMFPSVVLPTLPARISSNDMYVIIREHIKRNIDHDVTTISSDYDFHLAVDKPIDLVAPEAYQVTVGKGRSERKETRYHKQRSVRVLQLVPTAEDGRKFGGELAPSMEADNEELLKIKVEHYLAGLMQMINEPLVDCPTCKGLGVLTKVIA